VIKLVQEKNENILQDKYTVIKNGLVLTLDKNSSAGYFTVILKNGKIFLTDFENKFSEKEFVSKNPEAVIIDAKDKLVMPGLFNSALNSSFSLCSRFLDKCSYENLRTWHSLRLVENFISDDFNSGIMSELVNINYKKALKNGEVFISESSSCISKSVFDRVFAGNQKIKQYFDLKAYDQNILYSDRSDAGSINSVSMGLIPDEQINNYSLSSIKKSLAQSGAKFFIEASVSQNVIESAKKIFGKPFITVLSDMDLINSSTVVYNPTQINQIELDILKKKNASVLISPSDYLNLAGRKIDIDELLFSGLNIIIGTGYTGKNILTELKILSNIIPKSSLQYESVIKMAVKNPSLLFGLSNVTGSVERNKSADLILFSVDDIRNTLSMPEITGESVSEFIIQNLTIKDITDVLLKGEHVVMENRLAGVNEHELKIKSMAIADKLYKAGMYSEYKEKYLMRERVDKISLGGNSREETDKLLVKPEIFVDMTETGTYEGEGEFSIIGKKEEEFEKKRENTGDTADESVNFVDIKETGADIDILSESDKLQQQPQILKQFKKSGVKENLEVKEYSVDTEVSNITDIPINIRPADITGNIKIDEIEEIDKEINNGLEEKSTDDPKPAFKKGKLKFGFGDKD